MKDATYKDGILTVEGKRYIEVGKEDGGTDITFMILREEDDLDMKKRLKIAEWAFPEKRENIEDYDWENTAYLKSVR